MAIDSFIIAPGSNPADPTDPETIKHKRAIAEALMKEGSDYSPVQHWTQGLARMSHSLVGALQEKWANDEEKAGRASAAADRSSVISALLGGGTASASPPNSVAGALANPQGLPSFAQTSGPAGGYLTRLAAGESSGNDSAVNPTSGATGRYQFMPKTWRGLMATNPELGLTPDGMTDPGQQEKAVRAFTSQNSSALKSAGLPVNDDTLALAHQQGPGGARALLSSPNSNVVDTLAAAYGGNRQTAMKAVTGNGGSPDMTAGQFAQKVVGYYNKQNGGSSAGNARVQVASADPSFVPSGRSTFQVSRDRGLAGDVQPPAPSGAGKPQPTSVAEALATREPNPNPDTERTFQKAMSAGQPQQTQMTQPQTVAGNDAAMVRPEAIMRSAAAPQVQQAAAQAAQTPRGQQIIQASQGMPLEAISKALSNPWMSEGDRSLILMLAKQKIEQANPTYGFQTTPDGTILRTDPRSGSVQPIYQAQPKPGASVEVREVNGRLVSVDKATGKAVDVTPQGMPNEYRPMNPEEKARFGVPAGTPAYVKPNGEPHFGAPGVKVDMSPGSGQQVFKEVSERAGEARAAAQSLPAFTEATRLVDSGNIVLGAGADMRVAMTKIGALFGLDASAAANAETFRSAMAPTVLGLVKGLGAGSGISNADRDFAERAAGGNISLEPASIKRLIDIGMRAAQAKVAAHNTMLDEVYPADDPSNRQVRSLFGVKVPEWVPPQAGNAPGAQPTAPSALKQKYGLE